MFDSMLLTAHIFYGIDNSATLKHYLYKDNDFAHTKITIKDWNKYIEP